MTTPDRVPSVSLSVSRSVSRAPARRVCPPVPSPSEGDTLSEPAAVHPTSASPDRDAPTQNLTCTICHSPITLTHFGPIGIGVCRYDLDPNQDDQGQHVAGDHMAGAR